MLYKSALCAIAVGVGRLRAITVIASASADACRRLYYTGIRVDRGCQLCNLFWVLHLVEQRHNFAAPRLKCGESKSRVNRLGQNLIW